MRFTPDGPSLPDELLTARDAGQVLFFCGAGISQADAKLPNFAVLAERVLSLLGSATDSPARRLFNAARTFEEASGLTGLVATDRIFGMLEREFEASEVREAVATALRPEPGYVLDAHRTLLDLSRIRGGMPRVVTTNFDLLFEECELGLDSFNPPHLPDPGRINDFRGVIHLHGRVDVNYRRACDDELVLSSADFGHAYLSDGWATRYIQALLQRFRIVFVGYSADDPPVQYLLEALNRFARPANALYAFQSGNTRQAAEQWTHKGVEPISYDSADHHAALWKTLSAWAERARDVGGWHNQLIKRAVQGPGSMAPYERGMIAHLVSTSVGSKYLATSETILPADWLFVIDRNARYGRPGQVSDDEMQPPFDPFDAFGLDSDTLPIPTDPKDFLAKRDVPATAWDGMELTSADTERLPAAAAAQIRSGAGREAALPARLADLGWWLVKVAHQPAALWWAAAQPPLHPRICDDIERSLRHDATRFTSATRKGWRLLLASWQRRPRQPDIDKYPIEEAAKRDGWSSPLVREAIELYQPYLSVSPSWGVRAPAPEPEPALEAVLRLNIEYPRPHEPFAIPDNALSYAITIFRRQLEDTVRLESEIREHDHIYLDSIRADDGEIPDEDAYGLTGHLIILTNMVMRLAKFDRDAAHQEVWKWTSPDTVFTRLRIWSFGLAELTTPEEAGKGLLALSDDAFWDSYHERDLLFTLRDRWHELPSATIAELEERLRCGHFPWAQDHEHRNELIAHYRLNRLHWLATHGVTFSFDLDAEIALLRSAAPDWTEEATKYTAQPHVSKVRTVETDASSATLEQVPLGDILETAQNLAKHEILAPVVRQPFHGLAAAHPARALSAITDASRKGDYPAWAWRALLSSTNIRAESPRMLSAIGRRLARLEPAQLGEIVHPATEWLRDRCGTLYSQCPEVFDLVWKALRASLSASSGLHKFPSSDRRWVDESLNSAAGRMLDTLFKYPGLDDIKPDAGFPIAWSAKLDEMLALHADDRRYAIVMIASRLTWLYRTDRKWVDTRMLPLSTRNDADTEAFWAGFFWAARAPQPPLYLKLKQPLIALASQQNLRRAHANNLAGILLHGWARQKDSNEPEQLISDTELREIHIHAGDELRSSVLWYFQQWAKKPDSPLGENLLPFLERVWPRQRTVRTAQMSAKLVDLALAAPDRFSEIVTAILPRLVPIKGHSVVLARVNVNETILTQHPRALLDLLSIVLSPDPGGWPYGVGEILAQLAEQPTTRNDPRLEILLRYEQRA
ncbi:SIR2 family protein [Paraburkholderia tropica]|uniref:SIR2 family protein n=1 Tax=Paraburkholderia tropica TaxID=92647 RepID=UPI0031CF2AD1